MVTLVKLLWKHSPAARVSTAFLVRDPKLHSCYHTLETRKTFSIWYIQPATQQSFLNVLYAVRLVRDGGLGRPRTFGNSTKRALGTMRAQRKWPWVFDEDSPKTTCSSDCDESCLWYNKQSVTCVHVALVEPILVPKSLDPSPRLLRR